MAPVLPIPEVRDFTRINAQLAQWLDAGHRRVRLAGAEGQRLLVAGLKGPWEAVVEVEGRAGPELAADLDAPGLVVVARGPALDGAGRGLRAGRVLILGDAGSAVGFGQCGGLIVVAGTSGPRAGLAQAGGLLVLGGAGGRLAGDRQAGGTLLALGGLGSFAGRGRRGGRLVVASSSVERPAADVEAELRSAFLGLAPWLEGQPALRPWLEPG